MVVLGLLCFFARGLVSFSVLVVFGSSLVKDGVSSAIGGLSKGYWVM